MKNYQSIIDELGLDPHPEGGYYKRTYESSEKINTTQGIRYSMTRIFYLLPAGEASKFHRIPSNESWYYHMGKNIVIHIINKKGELTSHRLGPLENNVSPVVDVPGDTWFAAELDSDNGYCLVSCTVNPGFDFNDFELGKKEQLIEQFPEHSSLINKLT